MDKPKIFIVEDEADARESLKNFLTRNIECDTQEAADGRRALEILKNDVFDLILLDIKLPGISGIDVLKKAKENSPQTDVLILTGWDSQSVAEEIFKDGAVDYIIKSSPFKVSYDKICEILKKRNQYLPKKKNI